MLSLNDAIVTNDSFISSQVKYLELNPAHPFLVMPLSDFNSFLTLLKLTLTDLSLKCSQSPYYSLCYSATPCPDLSEQSLSLKTPSLSLDLALSSLFITSNDPNICVLAVTGSTQLPNSDRYLLGSHYLSNYFTVYD